MSAIKRALEEQSGVAALAVRATEPVQPAFTESQRKLIRETCCGGASEHDAQVLIAIAEARGMNPLRQECYFVERWDGEKGRKVWAVQASIDSFRIKAEETGLYAGQDEPDYEYNEKKQIVLARVKVYRKDWDRPMVGVARWDEYVQTKKDGTPSRFWRQMPHGQLAKCAEALALRKAFPKSFARIYTPEEMAQADNVPAGNVEQTGEVVDEYAALSLRIANCETLDELGEAWKGVNARKKAAGITAEEAGKLLAEKDARKVAIVERKRAEEEEAGPTPEEDDAT